jgi:tRNA G37 N-methylase Trm5
MRGPATEEELKELVENKLKPVPWHPKFIRHITNGSSFKFFVSPAVPYGSYFTMMSDGEESELMTFMLDVLKPGDTMIDVGAYCGYWTLAALCNGISAYAFEIDPLYFNILWMNVNLNEFAADFRATRAGLGNQDAIKPFFNLPNVVFKRLDSLLDSGELNPSKLNFIKMDIEGTELEALEGARKTLLKYLPDLYIECHLNYDPEMDKKVIKFIDDLEQDYFVQNIITVRPVTHVYATRRIKKE